jgi:hypothetical protein
LIGCVLFVLLREPAHPDFLAAVDAARSPCVTRGWAGGVYSVSGIDGTLACRILRSWSEWHGGEALGVKVLETVNLPALIVTVIVHIASEVLGIARRFSACGWSWVLGFLFAALSTAQWLLVGWLIDRGWTRLRRRAAGIDR